MKGSDWHALRGKVLLRRFQHWEEHKASQRDPNKPWLPTLRDKRTQQSIDVPPSRQRMTFN